MVVRKNLTLGCVCSFKKNRSVLRFERQLLDGSQQRKKLCRVSHTDVAGVRTLSWFYRTQSMLQMGYFALEVLH